MGEWSSSRRRPRKEAGWPTRTPKYGGLIPSSGHSCQSVPTWEINFCSQISWSKFCEDKKLAFLFENVLNWDDSAGKECFDNAKARYWAEINGLECDIPMPNPDMYIDIVDQNTFLDPRLVEDLYKPPPPMPHKEVPDYNSIEIIPTGWDVDDSATPGHPIPIFISAGDHQTVVCGNAVNNFPMELSRCDHIENPIIERDGIDEPVTIVPTGWGDEDFGSGRRSNDDLCFETREMDHKNVNFCERNYGMWEHNAYWNSMKNGCWGNVRDSDRQNRSKNASVRDRRDYYPTDGNRRGCGGRRNCANECYWHLCAPGNHQR